MGTEEFPNGVSQGLVGREAQQRGDGAMAVEQATIAAQDQEPLHRARGAGPKGINRISRKLCSQLHHRWEFSIETRWRVLSSARQNRGIIYSPIEPANGLKSPGGDKRPISLLR